jgi:hypothetical protein
MYPGFARQARISRRKVVPGERIVRKVLRRAMK